MATKKIKKTEVKETKSKPKKPRKKRATNLFKSDKDILDKKKKINSLSEERYALEEKIKDLFAEFNESSVKEEDAEGFFDKLPLNTLMDLEKFALGKKTDSISDLIEKRISLRKESNAHVAKIESLDKDIYLAQIDLVLAKIKCLNNIIDSKEENKE